MEVTKGLQELTSGMGTGQDVSLLSQRRLIKHMSVKTEPCLCRCMRLDQVSPGRISFPFGSPHFTSSHAGSLLTYIFARWREKGVHLFGERMQVQLLTSSVSEVLV